MRHVILALLVFYGFAVGYCVGYNDGFDTGKTVGNLDGKSCFLHNGVRE